MNRRRMAGVAPLLAPLCVLAAFLGSAAADDFPRRVDAWLDDEIPGAVALYRELHAAPELSLEEHATSDRYAAVLGDAGYAVTRGVGGTGVVAVLENGAGPTLLLRADLDALPVAEQTGLPYASEVRRADERGAVVGVMHACGHDIHMTNLLTTARFLAAGRDLWSGTLVVIGQPGEERGEGAQRMIQDGLLTRFPRPDMAVALHVAADMPVGMVGVREGYVAANVDSIDVVIRGRGGHGAAPHTTVDPVVVAAKLVLDLQTIASREIDPTEPVVVTVGSIHGGTKHNVIGDEVALQITVRSYSQEVREKVHHAIRRKAEAAAAGSGAPEPTVTISEGTPSLYNDPALTERVAASLRETLGADAVEVAEPSMGGEDFSRYGLAGVPICMFKLGTIAPERLAELRRLPGGPPSLHSALYYPDAEGSLRVGVRALAGVAIGLLEEPAGKGAPSRGAAGG